MIDVEEPDEDPEDSDSDCSYHESNDADESDELDELDVNDECYEIEKPQSHGDTNNESQTSSSDTDAVNAAVKIVQREAASADDFIV